MAKYRQSRLNEEIAKNLSEILLTIKDPRVSGALISITGVDCSADLKYAKIYYSALIEEKNGGDTQKGLVSATGYIRKQLAQSMNLRITPELKFVIDDSIKNGAHINELLKQVEAEIKTDGNGQV